MKGMTSQSKFDILSVTMSPTVETMCSACNKEVSVASNQLGHRIDCPNCHLSIRPVRCNSCNVITGLHAMATSFICQTVGCGKNQNVIYSKGQ